MADSYYLGAYWAARSESAPECADRLSRFLADLAKAHLLLTSWYQKGGSRADALRHSVATDAESLSLLLGASRKGRDAGLPVMEELGYSASLWNGEAAAAGLTVTCGSYSPRGQHPVPGHPPGRRRTEPGTGRVQGVPQGRAAPWTLTEPGSIITAPGGSPPPDLRRPCCLAAPAPSLPSRRPGMIASQSRVP
jgi:hypothetical protein